MKYLISGAYLLDLFHFQIVKVVLNSENPYLQIPISHCIRISTTVLFNLTWVDRKICDGN